MSTYTTIPWRILQYIRHLFYFRHRNGHGIHSPYLFDFIHRAVFNARGLEPPVRVREVHEAMRRECSLIPREPGGFGAGSRADFSNTRTISSFVKRSSVSRKYGALLFRITRWFEPDMILELGTGLGISAAYLSSGAPRVPMQTVEGSKLRGTISRQVFKRCQLEAVQWVQEDLDRKPEEILGELKGRFLVFVDANHRYEPTVRYLEAILQRAEGEALVILDDLYWSPEMYRAWRQVAGRAEVRASIDLFRMGILMLRPDLHKTSLKILF